MGRTPATSPVTVRDRAVRGFTARYGRAPEAVWSAPGRANLIGEHTDYNDGFVLPFAIAERTRGRRRAPRRRHDRGRLRWLPRRTGQARRDRTWHGERLVRLPVRRGVGARPGPRAQRAGGSRPAGADLFIDSDVPPGAGLSSSAALEMAAAGALAELWGLDLGTAEFARAGQRAENEVVGAPTGVMDQYASLLGQPDAAVFLDCRSLRGTVGAAAARGGGDGAGARPTPGNGTRTPPAATPPAVPPARRARRCSASARCATCRWRTCRAPRRHSTRRPSGGSGTW